MLKELHPKAFLNRRRNVRQGLKVRTQILSLLEEGALTAGKLAEKTGLSYNSILHHLHLLEGEYIIKRVSRKPYTWQLTGVGQKRLTEIIE